MFGGAGYEQRLCEYTLLGDGLLIHLCWNTHGKRPIDNCSWNFWPMPFVNDPSLHHKRDAVLIDCALKISFNITSRGN